MRQVVRDVKAHKKRRGLTAPSSPGQKQPGDECQDAPERSLVADPRNVPLNLLSDCLHGISSFWRYYSMRTDVRKGKNLSSLHMLPVTPISGY